MMHSPTFRPTRANSRVAIFTDLDGTLLDHRYSWEPASDSLEKLRSQCIPIILCTSKTRPETEHYRRELHIDDPFVVENGGAIFIPRDYFSHLPGEVNQDGDFHAIESDVSYAILLAALKDIKRRATPHALGFSDLSPEQLVKLTGLSLQEAIWAKDRHHDEPFLIPGDKSPSLDGIRRIVENRGLRYLRGTRFHHIAGPHDKGTAVEKLISLFRHSHKDFFSVGLGDSPMDSPFLEQVDLPIIVQNREGKYHPAFNDTAYLKSHAIGPEGWSMAVGRLFEVGLDHIHDLKPMKKENCDP